VAQTTSADKRARAQRQVRWELLVGLIRKDLKVKYQGSVLGFLWSLANPLMLLVVYTFVFQVVLKSGVPYFGYFLLSGLLIWNVFSGSVSFATEAVVGNAGLVKKVRFPLRVLPLTPVGFNLVHFALQMLVLVVAMLLTGFTYFLGWGLLLAIPAIAVAILCTVGLSYLVASLNVRYRDTKHLVEIALMAGFWLTPIVYSISLVQPHLHGWREIVYFLNPMSGVVVSMQRAFYAYDVTLAGGTKVLADPGYAYYLGALAIGGVVSALLLWVGLRVYHRLAADFAEEL
jgi:ABC-2 type transport system permease protein